MSPDNQRIHVTGGPGSGKSHFAQRLSAACSIPLHDLDGLLLAAGSQVERIDRDRIAQLIDAPEWISEGVYFAWALPFLERADAVIWLDVPWRVASRRMVTRHLRLELTRRNRFPGWKNFYSFWRWSARYYADRNDATVDRMGVPGTRSTVIAQLDLYAAKLIVCHNDIDAANTLAKLERA